MCLRTTGGRHEAVQPRVPRSAHASTAPPLFNSPKYKYFLHNAKICGTITIIICKEVKALQIEYSERELARGVTLKCIKDDKFKSNIVSIRLLTENSEKDLAALALLPSVLSYTNENYPSSSAMNCRLNELYGASLFSSCGQRGDMYEISISCEYILDKYTMGDKVACDSVGILIDCLIHPALERGVFAEEDFNIRKNDLLDSIDGEINDKISYALTLACETVYEGEAASRRYYGSRDEVRALTPERVFDVYKRVLATARVEVIFAGGGDFDSQTRLFDGIFKDRISPPIRYYSYSKIKPEAVYAENVLDVSQANMVLAFKTDYYNHFANRVMSAIYGAGYSKLFENVRERLSLCYFCDATYSEVKGTMSVVSAVDFDKIGLAQDEIIRQLSLVAQGDFTDDELTDKKHQIAVALRSSYDSVSALLSWYYLCTLRGEVMTIDEYIDLIQSVTRDEIIAAANSMKLDTVFVLKGGESEND